MTKQATEEQQAIIEAVKRGEDLRISAFAGTGKTTTLEMIGRAYPAKKGLYLAYNRAVLEDARGQFPNNVTCRTMHSLAYSVYGQTYRSKLSIPLTSMKVAEFLQISPLQRYHQGQSLQASDRNIAGCAITIVRHYCNSADKEISAQHLSMYHINQLINRYKRQYIKLTFDQSELVAPQSFLACYADRCLHIARQLWVAMKAIDNRKIGMTHDGYLKLYQLSEPVIHEYDFIMLDEAQDANPAILSIFEQQSVQRIYVGDQYQQIYRWRGSINAMDKVPGTHYYLTQTFRFGAPIAEVANAVLRRLGESHELLANPNVTSQIGALDKSQPYTKLCRTNAGILTTCLTSIKLGKSVVCVGGIRQALLDFKSAYYLWTDKLSAVKSEKIRLYGSWKILTEEASLTQDKELSGIIQFVMNYQDTCLSVIKTIEEAVTNDESKADVILSTVHKAKGREWSQVCLHTDFEDYEKSEGEELNLWYVAITRAIHTLDLSGDVMELFSEQEAVDTMETSSMTKALDDLTATLLGEKPSENNRDEKAALRDREVRKILKKSQGKSDRELRFLLARQGLEDVGIELALQDQLTDYDKICLLLDTKYRKQLTADIDYRAKHKLVAKLAKHGFAIPEIGQAIDSCIAGSPSADRE
tara:strand:+ start:1000 stop:2928 length:1929 start_codon:yes stop_codon:yes gene_type:complete